MLSNSGKSKKVVAKKCNSKSSIYSTTCRASRSACFASYTEKKLLVLKNFLFFDSQFSDFERCEKQDCAMSDENRSPGDASESGARKTARNVEADKRKTKPRSWMPNGGGMKPYNSPEVQNSIPPAEECIIDVNAVKPKVDTWFKPKTRGKSDAKNGQKTDAKTTRVIRSKVCSNRDGISTGGDTVKRLASFWDNRLGQQPYNMVAMLQKSHMSLDTYTRLEEKCTESRTAKNCRERPKSQDSDGVVQEHTLKPSQLRTLRGKMTSIGDIFIKRLPVEEKEKQQKISDILMRPRDCMEEHIMNPPNTPCSVLAQGVSLVQHCGDKASNDFANPKENSLADSQSLETLMKNRTKVTRPRYVMRLYPRWKLILRVLALLFQPVVVMKPKTSSKSSFSSVVELVSTSIENTCRPNIVQIHDQDELMSQSSSTLNENDELSELLDASAKYMEMYNPRKSVSRKSSEMKIEKIKPLVTFEKNLNSKSSCSSVGLEPHRVSNEAKNQVISISEKISIIREVQQGRTNEENDDSSWSMATYPRAPLICESLILEESARHSPRQSRRPSRERQSSPCRQPISSGGFRIAVNIEYPILFSFACAQAVLFLVVLSIKWLQRLTS